MTEIEARLTRLEGRSVKTEPIVTVVRTSPQKQKREPSIGLRGTTEAHQKLQASGYSKSIGTFRRHLATAIDAGEWPTDLVALGLVADFEVRRAVNPKDNSVRWLEVDPTVK